MSRFVTALVLALAVALGAGVVVLRASGVKIPVPAFLKKKEGFDVKGRGFFEAASELLDRSDLSDREAVGRAVDGIWKLTEDPRRRPMRILYYEQLLGLAAAAPSDELALELMGRMARSLARTGSAEEIARFERQTLRLLDAKPSPALLEAALSAHAGPLGSPRTLDAAPPFFGRLLELARRMDAAAGGASNLFEGTWRASFSIYAPQEETKAYQAFARQAVAALRNVPEPERVLRLLRLTQRDLRREGRREAQRRLAAAAVEDRWIPEFEDVELEALGTLAVVSAELGDTDRALAALGVLSGRAARATPARKARALLAEARARGLAGDRKAADAALARAWALVRAAQDPSLQWPILLERGRSLAAAGKDAEAGTAFDQAADAVEDLGAGDWALEAAEPPAAVFAEGIECAARRAAWAEGYAMTERARAFEAGAPPPPDAADRLAALQERLRAEDSRAIELLAVGDRLFVWYVGPDSAALTETAASERELRRKAEALAGALSFGVEEKDELARSLYEFLFRPELMPQPGSRLTITAQGPLAAVPFAELLDGDQALGARYTLGAATPPKAEGGGDDRGT